MLDLDEAKAAAAFKKLIFDGLNDTRRRLGMLLVSKHAHARTDSVLLFGADFMVHIIVHK